MFGKKRQDWIIVELHSLANLLTPAQMALFYTGCLLQKVLLMNGDILEEQVATFKKKMHAVLQQNNID